jgi:hypothetical protein
MAFSFSGLVAINEAQTESKYVFLKLNYFNYFRQVLKFMIYHFVLPSFENYSNCIIMKKTPHRRPMYTIIYQLCCYNVYCYNDFVYVPLVYSLHFILVIDNSIKITWLFNVCSVQLRLLLNIF